MTGRLDRLPETRIEKLGLGFLHHAPEPIIRLAAATLARSKPLAPQAGWYFDVAAEDPSRLVQFRRDLWQYYKDRAIQRPVTYRWYDGLRVHLFLGNDLSLCMYVGGAFEPNEFALLRKVLRPGMTYVDAGANDGLYSLFASRKVGDHGRVIAIEPSHREYERLLANLSLNKASNVEALKLALGADEGEVTLAIAEEGHEGQNTIGTAVSNPKVATQTHEVVPMRTLDTLVEERGLTRVDAVKLDVEGSEVDALEGAKRTIERYRPLLQIEAEEERLASQHRTKTELLGILGDHGYDAYIFDAHTGQLRPPVLPTEPEGNLVGAPAGWEPPTL